eukprot:Skav211602  [mRNA]  locus=scaffold2962:108453:117066:- [translate_table: standard]
MPSSFAYGGMENPNCTFMSASLIPGDRSLTPTLAHEIVHSWIGNLVTNALWKDFWLNEGFTRYIERRILRVLAEMLVKFFFTIHPWPSTEVFFSWIVMKSLPAKSTDPDFEGFSFWTVDMLTKQGTPGLTRLEPEINDIDPDDAFSRVPYEKGSLFLFYLEQIVGGEEAMTDWLRAYIHSFRERSIQTSDVKRHFLQFFKGVKRVKEIDWEHWLYGEGLPDFNLADYVDRSLVDESKSLADSWLSTSTSDAKTEHMKAQQWMLFLDHLINAVGTGTAISHSTLEAMDGKYKISSTSNVESAEVLDQLGSSLPTRCPAPLFAALYAVLTSPKLAYSAKSLGRLERLLAKSVIASNKGALSARFQLVVKLMSFALELLDSLKSASTSQTWQQHQQKIQELRAAVSASASKRWQQLSALEMDFVEDLKLGAVFQQVEENLKLSLEKEEAVRKKEEEAQLSKAQENLEQCRLAVLAMAEDGFKQKTQTAVTSGLKRCLSKMKNLHDAMQKTNPSPLTTEAWNTGRAAVQHFSAVRVQCSKAFQWLQKKQLGFCAQRLDNCGLLERLHVIRESPQKLATVGLPYRCCQLLLAAAEEDALSKETFGPKLEEARTVA